MHTDSLKVIVLSSKNIISLFGLSIDPVVYRPNTNLYFITRIFAK